MDTTPASEGHRDLIGFAKNADFRAPDDGEWSAETVIAHLIATDRMLIGACVELLEGRRPRIDNWMCLSLYHLDAIAAGATDLDGLLEDFEASGAELERLAAQIPDDVGETPLPTYLVDAGIARVDQELPISFMLRRFHLDNHRDQLAKLKA